MSIPAVPQAARHPHIRLVHGDRFEDNYEWLREKDSPAVLAHLAAENAYTDALMAPLDGLGETLFEEIRSRVVETDRSVPVAEGPWWYFRRTTAGQQYPVHCRAPRPDETDWTPPSIDREQPLPGEVVLLDENALAEGHEFFELGGFEISRDGRRMLYAIDVEGDERYALHVTEIATGTALDAPRAGLAAGAFFSPDGQHIIYPSLDESWRPDTLWLHRIGTDPSTDVVLWHEKDERFWLDAEPTRSGRFIALRSSSSVTSEWRLLDAADPAGEARIVWPRREGLDYEIEHAVLGGEDVLLITHNEDAEDFAVVAVPIAEPGAGPRDGVTVIAHEPGRRIELVQAFADTLVAEYRRDALPRLALARLSPASTAAQLSFAEVELEDPLASAGLAGNPVWDQPVLRIGYDSFARPAVVADVDIASGEILVRKRQEVPGGHDPEAFRQWREWALAPDGTRIPVSLIARADTVLPAPLHLYGYGAYEASMDPSFSVARLSVLERGGVFAIAHVRGGGEMGRHWYEQGRLAAKPNSFRDFTAVAEHLLAAQIAAPGRIVAEGASAGGLLMGAVANLAPELFAGVLAGVPFVDPLTSMLDAELPLTVVEWDEWGNPVEDAEIYHLMRGYSPYENVRADVAYPRMLVTTGLNDTRVLYVEPAKWVARLREVDAPVLLRTEMAAGHGGVSGRYRAWRDRAFELSWILDVLGLGEAVPRR